VEKSSAARRQSKDVEMEPVPTGTTVANLGNSQEGGRSGRAETIHHAGTKETENTSGRLATINTPQEEGKEDWTVAKGDRRELEVGRGEDLGSAEE
jgi:hypothetical protein